MRYPASTIRMCPAQNFAAPEHNRSKHIRPPLCKMTSNLDSLFVLGIVSLRLNIAFHAPLMMMIVAVIAAVIVSVISAGLTTLTAIKVAISILAPL